MKFTPQTARDLHTMLCQTIKKWDGLSDEQKASGDWINPDDPVVLSIENPEFFGDLHAPDIDSFGEPRYDYWHIESIGGGFDVDEDGEECGHTGMGIGGMEIDPDHYLFNGRRLK